MQDTTIKQLKTEGWEGCDAGLAISLFKYGLIWRTTETEIEFIHRIERGKSYYYYDCCSFPLNVDVYEEWNWVKWAEFYMSMGTAKDGWDTQSLSMKVYDLYCFYGDENIFGTVYYKGAKIPDDENPYPKEDEDAEDA